jgi:hypothetical protein
VKDLARQPVYIEAESRLPPAECASINSLDEHTANIKNDSPDGRRILSSR